MISIKSEINYSWWLLRMLFGINFIGAGVDKFFGFVTNWHQFINPSLVLLTKLPVTAIVFGMGAIELGLGILVFTRWVKTAALFIAVWMISNGLYLAFFNMYLDTAARYCTLGIGALVLFHLTRVREKLANT